MTDAVTGPRASHLARGWWTRQATVALAVGALVLLSFATVQALAPGWLQDPFAGHADSAAVVALAGPLLLAADVALPVPSSVVMTVHGGVFGLTAGAALSLVGGLAGFAVAWSLGRAGARRLARDVAAEQRASRLIRRWGVVAIVVTRPVPVLAEAVAVTAGAAGMPLRQALAGAAAGLIPAAVLWAAVGAAVVPEAPALWLLLGASAAAGILACVTGGPGARET